MTVPFEFKSDRHSRIKRDLGSLDRRAGEQGLSDEGKAKVKSQPSDLIGKKSMVGRYCEDREENYSFCKL
jgi:hypothetical protein